MRRVLGGVAAVLLLAGCAVEARPAQPPDPSIAALPLYLAPEQAKTATEQSTGAAGAFVQCRGTITGEFRPGRYEGGETGKTPTKGLREALDEGAFDGPQDGYVLERQDGDRALFTARNEDRIVMAVILLNGPALGAPAGWHPEAWARCDVSEFPREAAEANGLQLWDGRDGRPARVEQIQSWPGAEHCDWQQMTFLHLGGQDKLPYVRQPAAELLEDYFAEDWNPKARLPADAYDTGYSRDGRHLWLSQDRKRAYVGEPGAEHVEMWPRTTQQLGCI